MKQHRIGNGPRIRTAAEPHPSPSTTVEADSHLLHLFAFFWTYAKLNTFRFKRLRTLWGKTAGSRVREDDISLASARVVDRE
jgi:hypothetical protein